MEKFELDDISVFKEVFAFVFKNIVANNIKIYKWKRIHNVLPRTRVFFNKMEISQ